MQKKMRLEKDLLGEINIETNAYWGKHTQRAVENFNITGRSVNKRLIKSMALVKKAACLANREIGMLPDDIAAVIERACDDIIEGKLDDQFVVDAYQGGAGTSTNMNVNEVIANRALELLNNPRGQYSIIDPIEHVNLHQSTNDVYPTAVKIAVIYALRELSGKIAKVQGAFQIKEKEFASIVKIGRTEMQEAVPMTLGAEIGAFSEAFSRDRWRTFKCEERLRMTNIGGTAIGTGLTAPQEYIFLVIEKLREITGLNISRGENIVDQTANADCFVEVSGILKAHAGNLMKISNDLRLLNFIGEIRLPAAQTGSSIMPGKINPVIPESILQAGMKTSANDSLIFNAVSQGTLQICEFMPIVADAMLDSLDMLIRANEILSVCTNGIIADEKKCLESFNNSHSIITAFLPHIGYLKSEELVNKFNRANRRDFRLFLENELGKELVDEVLSPEKLTMMGYKNKRIDDRG